MKYETLAIGVCILSGCIVIGLTILFFKDKLKLGKHGSKIDAMSAYFTMLAAILGPVFAIVSSLLFVSSLKEQRRATNDQIQTSKQNNYNANFELLMGEIERFVDGLEVEVTYNRYSTEPEVLKRNEVISELALYLKKAPGEAIKCISKKNVPDMTKVLTKEDAWFTAKLGEIYIENGMYYQIVNRPEKEKKYFEELNNRFRTLFIPMFELLKNDDNQNRNMQKHIFAAYLNEDVFEAFLTTRWKKQVWPDTDLLVELIEYSNSYNK
jgi:hypothetical protein